MCIRTISRKIKDGPVVLYIQLAHKYRNKEVGRAKAKVLKNFGRHQEIDKDVLKRLVENINRFLGTEEVLKTEANEILTFLSSKSLG